MKNAVSINLDILKPIFDFELFKVNAQDKEDVKQTAIVRILESLKKYNKQQLPEEKLFSFAQVIVKRTVVDYYRKRGRKIEKNSTSVNWCDSVDEETGSGGADAFNTSVPDFGYDIADARIDYYYNRDKFTPQERKIIDYLLFHDHSAGMNLSEISSEVGVNKSHATRALQRLREICADRI